MSDTNLLFTIVFSVMICYDVMLSHQQIRERRAEMSRSAYRMKVISLCLSGGAVLIWFGFAFLYLHYDETRPTMADESSGRIYSLSNHGHVVFLTWIERYYLFLLGTIAIASFLCGYILDRRVRKSLTEAESDSTLQ